TQIALGFAITVRRRGIEVVDAELHRPRDRALALGRCAADDEPADVAAAESERRDPETRLAEIPELHARLLVLVVGNYSPMLRELSSRRPPRGRRALRVESGPTRNARQEERIDRSYVTENNRERARLRALVDRLSDSELARPLEAGWTIAAVLAHLAFWDQRVLELIARWERDGLAA